MKTTVSIPDRIFRSAEGLAEQWGISRSALYAKALTAFIRKHESQMITARLNEIYGKNRKRSAMEAGIAVLQRHSLVADD